MSNLYLKYFEVHPGERKLVVGNFYIDPDKEVRIVHNTKIYVNQVKVELEGGGPLGYSHLDTLIPTEFASALASIMIRGGLHFIDSVLNILTRSEYYEIHLHGIGGSDFSW